MLPKQKPNNPQGIRIISLFDDEVRTTLLETEDTYTYSINRETLATTILNSAKWVNIWDLKTQKSKKKINMPSPVRSITVTNDGTSVLINTLHTFAIYNLKNNYATFN